MAKLINNPAYYKHPITVSECSWIKHTSKREANMLFFFQTFEKQIRSSTNTLSDADFKSFIKHLYLNFHEEMTSQNTTIDLFDRLQIKITPLHAYSMIQAKSVSKNWSIPKSEFKHFTQGLAWLESQNLSYYIQNVTSEFQSYKNNFSLFAPSTITSTTYPANLPPNCQSSYDQVRRSMISFETIQSEFEKSQLKMTHKLANLATDLNSLASTARSLKTTSKELRIKRDKIKSDIRNDQYRLRKHLTAQFTILQNIQDSYRTIQDQFKKLETNHDEFYQRQPPTDSQRARQIDDYHSKLAEYTPSLKEYTFRISTLKKDLTETSNSVLSSLQTKERLYRQSKTWEYTENSLYPLFLTMYLTCKNKSNSLITTQTALKHHRP
jgi:hypothetical protein